MRKESFFEILHKELKFYDRKLITNESAVDVIIPILNTNILFERNLYSFYKEIPINRLIIGDGGTTDDSLDILKKFPRVKIIDQKKNKSLGYCIAELISLVETEWFIYLHADVYLPENWYDKMIKYQNSYDFFECTRINTILFEYMENDKVLQVRANSGSQMGRTKVFKNIIPIIEDDYLYRNEDIVIRELLLEKGFKYGWIFDTFHFHQIMNKKGELEPKLNQISISKAPNKNWEISVFNMQVRGLVKYTNPRTHYLIRNFKASLQVLKKYNALNLAEFRKWVKETNQAWLKFIEFQDSSKEKIKNKIQNCLISLYNKVFNQ